MKDDFSTLDIEKALKIPLEKQRGWMKRHFFFPTHESKGQGQSARFTRDDLYTAALIEKLMDNGLHGVMAGAMAQTAFKEAHNRDAHYILFSHEKKDGTRITKDTTFHHKILFSLKDFPEGWGHVQIINLDKIREYVNKSLKILG